MPTRRLYYRLKPYLPWQLRMRMRQIIARHKRKKYRNVWPINGAAGCLPADWPGWPDKKKFALVLTHDVEGLGGLAKCRQLMKLEMEFGFRSSFNFIPEGEYIVSPEFRRELVQNGFEVGVHDLYHDGKLYLSRQIFSKNAECINHYLNEWGAKGFRSGFMMHEADWLHDLNIQYDASTFDTDPFEPQPDGAGTIFPFWVPAPEAQLKKSDFNSQTSNLNQGYVELPYTLVQDSTLFLLLGAEQPDIWFQKLDWIAKHGGMALVNVHPDYVSFDKQRRRGTYPIEKYADLLRYVSQRYPGEFWHSTPLEVAKWYRGTLVVEAPQMNKTIARTGQYETAKPTSHFRPKFVGKRAAVLLYSYYANDPRPRRAAEALVRAGMEVDVVCLSRTSSKPWYELLNGVNVFRVPLRRRRSSKLTYVFQYSSFLFVSFLVLSVWRFKRRYDLVHVHNMPDFLVFGALVPRLLGAKVILDLHDPMPELFSSIYNIPATHSLPRLLRKSEKYSIAFADLVFTPNIAFRELFISRGCPREKIQIVMNTPQEHIFTATRFTVPREVPPKEKPFTLMYHGLLVERHGLDMAIRAMAQLRTRIPSFEFHVYGEPNAYFDSVMQLVRELGLETVVRYHGFKPLEVIAQAISIADVGLIPNRLNAFTRINLPTRIFEYLAMKKPVIVPSTNGIRDYFNDRQIIYFEPGNTDDLAKQIEWVYSHPTETKDFVQNGLGVYNFHRWDSEVHRYLGKVEGLLREEVDTPTRPPDRPQRRICMVSYSNYDTDNRVMRYAETLAGRGDQVEVLAVKGNRNQARTETIRGVNICRIAGRHSKNQQTKLAHLLPVLKFWAFSSVCLSWRHLKQYYDLVHIHNVPDFLVFAAWLPKLTGAKVILDIHDMLPEFYANKFQLPADGFEIRLLKKVEHASARFADHVIISNHLWRDKFASRSAPLQKCSVFLNLVDRTIFRPAAPKNDNGKFIVNFSGGLQSHQGLDVAIRAFALVVKILPEAELQIYGDGSVRQELVELAECLSLSENVQFHDPIPMREIASIIARTDLGVVPKRADSFGNEAYSTKILEFMAAGVPVVVSRTKIDSYYFNESVVRFFEAGNAESLAEAIVEMIRHPEVRQRLVQNARAYVELNSWDAKRNDYVNLIDELIEGNTPNVNGYEIERPTGIAKTGN